MNSSLVSINIPSTVTSLGYRCFAGCSKLTSITIPSSVTSLGRYCFYGCLNLTDIYIPNTITSLGDGCFENCSSLTSITIQNVVTSLGEACLRGCTSLTSIAIPNSVVSLGSSCLNNCSNLFEIKCLPVTPPSFSSVSGIDFSSCYLFVPSSSIEAYKSAEGWKDFTNIYGISGETSEDPLQCSSPAILFADGKLQITSETEGAEFHYSISSTDITSESYSEDGEISLAASYNISAYATADGYTTSETTTATLYWLNGSLSDPSGISATKSRGVIATAKGGIITISGLDENEPVSFYNAEGKIIGNTTAVGGAASLATSATGVVIAKIGSESIKIAVE